MGLLLAACAGEVRTLERLHDRIEETSGGPASASLTPAAKKRRVNAAAVNAVANHTHVQSAESALRLFAWKLTQDVFETAGVGSSGSGGVSDRAHVGSQPEMALPSPHQVR